MEKSNLELDETMQAWLTSAVGNSAADLHLIVGYPPCIRRSGRIVAMNETPLDEATFRQSWKGLVPVEEITNLNEKKNLDLASEIMVAGRVHRLRINLFLSEGRPGACIRLIPDEIPDYARKSFPSDVLKKLTAIRHGLVLFTGITGSGKSTSLAMLIEKICERGGQRILTIEDPIEFRFPIGGSSMVTQRQLGRDVDSFSDGLKFGLRQDPDVVFVGEIRDMETARMTLSAAETGHLVLSTLHTRDAKGAISRFADLFPQSTQAEIRASLACNLKSIVCQRLLESSVPDETQELAIEILHNNSAIASAIRLGKLESIDNYILTGKNEGMTTMDESIKRLVLEGRVLRDVAEPLLMDPTFLNRI